MIFRVAPDLNEMPHQTRESYPVVPRNAYRKGHTLVLLAGLDYAADTSPRKRSTVLSKSVAHLLTSVDAL